MSKPTSKTVSVVLATYNGAKYIEEQIRSIAAQTLAPFELIISDDASTDNTLQIIQDLLSECDFKIKIIRNEKALGFRDNFLQACLLAQGDFIAFSDQDDVWHPTKLEKCSEFFGDKRISLIVHAASLIDDDSNHIGMFRQGITATTIKLPLSYDPWWTFWGFSMVFRREIIELIDIKDRFIDYIVPSELIAHDRWVMLLGQMVGAIAEIKDPLVSYRQHANNLFGDGSRKRKHPAFDIRERSETYIKATSQMVGIVSKIPSDVNENFPLFDKGRCLGFLNSALLQLTRRHTIYESDSTPTAFRQIWECLGEGSYRNVHDGSIRWKSLMRDVKFAALGA
ncbi:glycosyltransferase [Bradyrhizobium sp. dw_78]|uniref:glycosyltransferase n=1 Tax=Bradyrhizobium sp. dw_78 TaxID=2719793 RepID=UPI001BD3EDF3|nr:glycosyltransferase [Bradyrhizobium sp. dw_78]